MSFFATIANSNRIVRPPEILVLRDGLTMDLREWNISARLAPFWYLYWNETPGAELHFADRRVPLTPENLVLIPPYTLYSTRLRQPVRNHHFIQFTAAAPFRELKPHELTFPATAAHGYFQRFFSARIFQAMELYRMIYGLLLDIPADCFISKRPETIDPRIVRVLDYLQALPQTGADNRNLSRMAGMSPSAFSHLFKQETGTSPQHYLLHRRLETALALLSEPGADIAAVAAATGFADRYHFSKAFKAFYHQTPGAMRRELIGGPPKPD